MKATAHSPREKAKRTIVKLLELAKRPGTPAEGENAMQKAEALAAKHGLVIRKVTPATRTGRSQEDILNDIFRTANQYARARHERQQRTSRFRTPYDAPAYDETQRERTERRRKRTTWLKAHARGYMAFQHGDPRFRNPYTKMVWGVDLPRAWRAGWDAAEEQS